MAKRLVAFVGSPRKGETLRAVNAFENRLREKLGDLEFEIVHLREFRIEPCRGCFLCLTRGDELCPHYQKDDLHRLLSKMNEADGVIFASPNYCLQVSGLLKTLLDRCAFICHRPRFFHKPFMAIVTQGVIGAGDIVKYLDKVARYWGFDVVKGVALTTVTPRPRSEEEQINRKISAAADRFCRALRQPRARKPSWFMVMIFRLARSSHAAIPNEHSCDYRYFRDRGWFESGYYYPVQLGFPLRCLAAWIDRFATKQALKRHLAVQETERHRERLRRPT